MKVARKPRVVAPAPPPLPPPVMPAITWERRSVLRPSWQHHGMRLRELAEMALTGGFVLPDFQRSYVWTDDQVVRLFDSILRGYHVGTMFLWLHWALPPREVDLGGVRVMSQPQHVAVVVDGQQRIASIARAAGSDRFAFDLLTGQLLVEPEPRAWVCPSRLVIAAAASITDTTWDWAPAHAAQWGLDPRAVERVVVGLHDTIASAELSAITFERGYKLAEIVETYRRMATEGTPHSAEDLGRALATLQEAA